MNPLDSTPSPEEQNPHKPLPKLPFIIAIFLLLLLTALGIFFVIKHQEAPTHDSSDEPEVSLPIPGTAPPYNFDYSWSQHNPYIAHAMGGILGDTYTNSYEAFLLNYQMGHRVFEIDLALSSDDELVLTHDQLTTESNGTEVTTSTATFLSTLTNGKYHRLTYQDFTKILSDYPDVYLITDSKSSDPDLVQAQFSKLVSVTQAVNPELLNRLIIQIYNPAMLDLIMHIYPWRSVIYTLYNDPDWTPENVKTFAEASGVKYITMWSNWVTPEIIKLWSPLGIKIAAHTINNLETANSLRALGVDNIYTDFLLP